jgi:hypothetical protein
MSEATVPAVRSEREPWEKRPRESYKAFNAFAVFRDLGPERTLPKVAAAVKKSISMIQQWSSRHDWLERADAYDLYVDRRLREQRETDIEEATRIERTAGLSLQRVALERIRGKGREGEDDFVPPLNPTELTAQDVARFLAEGVRIRRLSDGQPTDMIRGAFLIAPAEMERVVREMIELALPLIPEELHERYILGCQAIGASR